MDGDFSDTKKSHDDFIFQNPKLPLYFFYYPLHVDHIGNIKNHLLELQFYTTGQDLALFEKLSSMCGTGCLRRCFFLSKSKHSKEIDLFCSTPIFKYQHANISSTVVSTICYKEGGKCCSLCPLTYASIFLVQSALSPVVLLCCWPPSQTHYPSFSQKVVRLWGSW